MQCTSKIQQILQVLLFCVTAKSDEIPLSILKMSGQSTRIRQTHSIPKCVFTAPNCTLIRISFKVIAAPVGLRLLMQYLKKFFAIKILLYHFCICFKSVRPPILPNVHSNYFQQRRFTKDLHTYLYHVLSCPIEHDAARCLTARRLSQSAKQCVN